MSEYPNRAGAPGFVARPMAEMPVRVRFSRHESNSRWQSFSWRLQSVEPFEPREPVEPPGSGESGVPGGSVGQEPLLVQVFRDEAEGYYLNVTSPEPSIFVLWRNSEESATEGGEAVGSESVSSGAAGVPHAIAVSVSYNEASRWMDGGEQVDRVPMPQGMAAWLVDFVNQHYKPEQSRKRKGPKMSFMDREAHARLADAERNRSDGGPSDT